MSRRDYMDTRERWAVLIADLAEAARYDLMEPDSLFRLLSEIERAAVELQDEVRPQVRLCGT